MRRNYLALLKKKKKAKRTKIRLGKKNRKFTLFSYCLPIFPKGSRRLGPDQTEVKHRFLLLWIGYFGKKEMLLNKYQILMSVNGGLRDKASSLKHLLAMSTLSPLAKNISIILQWLRFIADFQDFNLTQLRAGEKLAECISLR